MRAALAALSLVALVEVACAQAPQPVASHPQPGASAPAATASAPATRQGVTERIRAFTRGMASWYGERFHGKRTASGERYDMNDFTAAHPSLPFGTVVQVRSLVNGRVVNVRINDRGPFGGRRVIDLSAAAAEALGLSDQGTKRVELRVVPGGQPGPVAAGAGEGAATPESGEAQVRGR